MIIVDTFAWVEYFLGSKKGKIVEEYLNENNLVTPSIVLIELSCKSAKENWNFGIPKKNGSKYFGPLPMNQVFFPRSAPSY